MLAIDLACYLRVQPRVVRQQTEEAITMMKINREIARVGVVRSRMTMKTIGLAASAMIWTIGLDDL